VTCDAAVCCSAVHSTAKSLLLLVTIVFFSLTYPECSVPPEKGLQLLGRLALVGKDELNEVNGLPNQNNSSDHLPLLTRFRLNP